MSVFHVAGGAILRGGPARERTLKSVLLERDMRQGSALIGIVFCGIALCALAASITPEARAEDANPATTQLVDLKTAAAQTGLLKRMAEIKSLAGLDGASSGDFKVTIFAPSDAAFEALPEDFKTAILKPENRAHLADLLLHHAVLGEYPTDRLLKARARHYGVEAIDGSMIEFTVKPKTGAIDIHGAKVVRSDIIAANGILHVIDKVLIPRSVIKALEAPAAQQTAAAQ